MQRRSLIGCVAALALSVAASAAHAAWPDRLVTLIVPWAAGGGSNATARNIGSLLEKEPGQQINVVNRTGGSGVVGRQGRSGSRHGHSCSASSCWWL